VNPVPEGCSCLPQANLFRTTKESKAKRASRAANTPDCELDKGARSGRLKAFIQ